jgi:hypothetical protein
LLLLSIAPTLPAEAVERQQFPADAGRSALAGSNKFHPHMIEGRANFERSRLE